MKKTLIILGLLMAFISSKAQTITADEMIKETKCKTFDCFNDFIITKGFSYDAWPNKSQNRKMYVYTSYNYENVISPSKRIKNDAALTIYKDNSSKITFRTTNIEHYKKLLAEFKAKGFLVTKESTAGDMVTAEYKSHLYPDVLLTVTVADLDKDGVKWVSYCFETN